MSDQNTSRTKKSHDKNYCNITVHFSKEMGEGIKEYSMQNNLSVNQAIINLVSEALKNHKIGNQDEEEVELSYEATVLPLVAELERRIVRMRKKYEAERDLPDHGLMWKSLMLAMEDERRQQIEGAKKIGLL